MFTHLFEYLDRLYDLPGAGLFRYITFRAGAAIILSLLITMVFGAGIIRRLQRLQIGESVRDLGLKGQKEKEGTPTMGGLIIILAILVPSLLLSRLDNVYIQLMLLSTVWMGVIGFIDDYIKVFKKNKAGLKGIFKVIGQIGLGLIVGAIMLMNDQVTVRMTLEEAQTGGYEITQFFNSETTTTDQVQAVAAAVSITAPLFLLVMAFQKQIVSGLTAGAVKG